MFLSKRTQLVAIDIGSSYIKLAELSELNGGKFELTQFGMIPIAQESIVEGVIKKPELVIQALTNLVKAEKIQNKYVVSAVAGEAVFVKKIKVPTMLESEISKKITQEVEQYIPFDIDDVVLDFQILGTVEGGSESSDETDKVDKDMTEILLVAVHKEVIDERTDILIEAGLKPAVIDLNVFALMNAAQLTNDLSTMGTTALIDLGDSFTHINIIQDGKICYTRDIPVGGGYCTKKLMSKFQVPFRQALEIKKGSFPEEIKEEEVVKIISQAYKKVLEEVEKSFEHFSELSGVQVGRVLICGGGSMIRGVEEILYEYLQIPVEVLDPMQGVKVNPKKFDQSLLDEMSGLSTVALGLATRRFDHK